MRVVDVAAAEGALLTFTHWQAKFTPRRAHGGHHRSPPGAAQAAAAQVLAAAGQEAEAQGRQLAGSQGEAGSSGGGGDGSGGGGAPAPRQGALTAETMLAAAELEGGLAHGAQAGSAQHARGRRGRSFFVEGLEVDLFAPPPAAGEHAGGAGTPVLSNIWMFRCARWVGCCGGAGTPVLSNIWMFRCARWVGCCGGAWRRRRSHAAPMAPSTAAA